MNYLRLAWLGSGLLLLVACGGDDDDGAPPEPGDSGLRDAGGETCEVELSPGDDDQTTLQGALIDAESGDTVCLAAGRYVLTGQLSLATPDVTVRGEEGTILDFTGQTSGANGIAIAADGDTLDTLRIENPSGDGVRATNVDGLILRNIHVEWTEGPSPDNGGYGLYPVMSSNVLIEDCYAAGASDTGIYVGQSENVVIRNNETTLNVAGIEVENSTDVEVYGNHSYGNTGGLLIFNLPGLPVKDGKRTHVHDNVLEDNNLENFAEAGIVADVPAGTGMFVLSSDDNEIHHNEIRDHDSLGIAILSWYVTQRDSEGEQDPMFDFYPERNYVHDNTLENNGQMPHDQAMTIAALVSADELTDLVWDGIYDVDKAAGEPDEPDPAGTTAPVPPMSLRNCFQDNGEATFLNLDLEMFGARKSLDVSAYDCEHPGLPAIEL